MIYHLDVRGRSDRTISVFMRTDLGLCPMRHESHLVNLKPRDGVANVAWIRHVIFAPMDELPHLTNSSICLATDINQRGRNDQHVMESCVTGW